MFTLGMGRNGRLTKLEERQLQDRIEQLKGWLTMTWEGSADYRKYSMEIRVCEQQLKQNAENQARDEKKGRHHRVH